MFIPHHLFPYLCNFMMLFFAQNYSLINIKMMRQTCMFNVYLLFYHQKLFTKQPKKCVCEDLENKLTYHIAKYQKLDNPENFRICQHILLQFEALHLVASHQIANLHLYKGRGQLDKKLGLQRLQVLMRQFHPKDFDFAFCNKG